VFDRPINCSVAAIRSPPLRRSSHRISGEGVLRAVEELMRRNRSRATATSAICFFAPDIDRDDIKPKPLPPRHATFKGAYRGSCWIVGTIVLSLRVSCCPHDLGVDHDLTRTLWEGVEHALGFDDSGIPRQYTSFGY
jgi:hypothetical protein